MEPRPGSGSQRPSKPPAAGQCLLPGHTRRGGCPDGRPARTLCRRAWWLLFTGAGPSPRLRGDPAWLPKAQQSSCTAAALSARASCLRRLSCRRTVAECGNAATRGLEMPPHTLLPLANSFLLSFSFFFVIGLFVLWCLGLNPGCITPEPRSLPFLRQDPAELPRLVWTRILLPRPPELQGLQACAQPPFVCGCDEPHSGEVPEGEEGQVGTSSWQHLGQERTQPTSPVLSLSCPSLPTQEPLTTAREAGQAVRPTLPPKLHLKAVNAGTSLVDVSDHSAQRPEGWTHPHLHTRQPLCPLSTRTVKTADPRTLPPVLVKTTVTKPSLTTTPCW